MYTMKRITGSFAGAAGEKMDIELEYVKEIPREKSGKFRWVVSRISKPEQA